MALVRSTTATTSRRRARIAVALTAALLLVVGVASPPAPAARSRGHQTVLGRKGAFGPQERGWGARHPDFVYTGYGQLGSVLNLTWRHWNSATAVGRGEAPTIKPGGGYDTRLVKVRLRAGKIGHCYRGGPRAYRVLWSKQQTRPGSSRWTRWHRWQGVKSICRGR